MLPEHMLPTWNEFGIGLANHIWQSTIFAIGVGALTLLFRKNSAVVRYRLWLIASVKFLIPFSVLVGLGGVLDWTPVQQFTPAKVPVVIRQIGLPFSVPPALPTAIAAPAVPTVAGKSSAPLIVFVWFVGATSVLLIWFFRWRQVARVVWSSSPLEATIPWLQVLGRSLGVRMFASPAGMEPGVFGILRPALLIPEDLSQHLTSAQLEPIIAHEMFHVHGRDNLAAAVHTIVEAAFWFHPMVWWLGNRLVDERERACDEAVLQLGYKPADYAEGILAVCKRYVVAPACVAGVSGSNLKERIEAIMENRKTHHLSLGKKLMLVCGGTVLLVGPLLSGVKGMPKVAAVSMVSVLASPAPAYVTASKAAAAVLAQTPAIVRPQRASDDISIITTVEEHDAVLNLAFRIVQPSLPVPPQGVAPSAVQSAAEQQKWLNDVSIIIPDPERRSFQQLTKEEERQTFITNFWLARDPTPGTPANEFKDEYNRRVSYANEHFTPRSGLPGFQTDRGKLYILNGPPDEIVSHPSGGVFIGTGQGNNFVGGPTTLPFETWRYRNLSGREVNVVYEFVDKQMNGEYTLEYDPSAKVK